MWLWLMERQTSTKIIFMHYDVIRNVCLFVFFTYITYTTNISYNTNITYSTYIAYNTNNKWALRVLATWREKI